MFSICFAYYIIFSSCAKTCYCSITIYISSSAINIGFTVKSLLILTSFAALTTKEAAPLPNCTNNLLIDLTTISPAKEELENPAALVNIPKLFPFVEPNLISGKLLFLQLIKHPQELKCYIFLLLH
jgi:hypothetical protein